MQGLRLSKVGGVHSQTLFVVMGKTSDLLPTFQDSFSAVMVESGVEAMSASLKPLLCYSR